VLCVFWVWHFKCGDLVHEMTRGSAFFVMALSLFLAI